MAATYFRGATTDFGANGNWSNQAPDSTHTPAVFDGSITQTSALVNLNRGADLFTLVTKPDYHGDIGGLNNPLIWKGDVDNMARTATILGGGKVYIQNGLALTSEIVINAPRSQGIYIQSYIDRLVVAGGPVTLDAKTDFNGPLWIFGNGTKVTLVPISAAEHGPTRLYQHGGYFYNKRHTVNGDVLTVSAGELIQTGRWNVGTEVVIDGGIVSYKPDVGYAGAVVDITGQSGLLDVSEIGDDMTWGNVVLGPEMQLVDDIQGSFAVLVDMRKKWP